jgi:hypothetical protein
MKIKRLYEAEGGMAIYPFLDQDDESNHLHDTHVNAWDDNDYVVPVIRYSDSANWNADKIRQFIDALDVALDMIEGREEAK